MSTPSAPTKRWGLVAGVVIVLLVAGVIIGRKWFAPAPEKPGAAPAPLRGEEIAGFAHSSLGKKLFDTHCAQCHGEQGDGKGLAASFLYPKPRDFREGKFRLVTTSNRLPTDEDLLQVITRGMPGSAMLPFGHLGESDRKMLVTYVRQLTRTGIEERLRQAAEKAGDEVDPTQLAKDVDKLAQVGEALTLPANLPTGADAVTRGRTLYMTSCATCHGETGKGDGGKEQRDDDGTPTQPRDFTRGIFKGGRDSRQLFARIAIGMPGTPMPASPNLKAGEIGAMVAYVQSLSEPAAQTKVEHKRTTILAKRVSLALDNGVPEECWQSAPAAFIVVGPLWWRDYPEPGLTVQALHDGKTIAVRMTWNDPTMNEQIARPQDFEDMVAVQFHKGSPEPFVGMGFVDKSIDIWHWRASWQAEPADSSSLLDEYPFESPLYESLTRGKEKGNPPTKPACAVGNQHTRLLKECNVCCLTAAGFGSTTFRPPAAQVVRAASGWNNGQWTVVLRRSLTVKADDGIVLAPGEQCSIAFALFDGEVRDRAAQKLISIWHDLKLE